MRKKTPVLSIIPECVPEEPVEVKSEPLSPAPPKDDKPVFRRKSKKCRPVISDTISAVPVAAFQRLIREIGFDRNPDIRWEKEALEALQVDAEAYLIEKFDKGNKRRRLNLRSTLNREHFTGEPVSV